ncbi:MAG: tripartite tricarboxylate transporter substrate binding protein, partial [Proteobacteria bacterium]|nr:tripartite tricarboxylate transporter substrate binding protein [Burkholderiales bacterium]
TAYANAQPSAPAYPSRVIRLFVGFAPGGGTDIIARMLGAKLAESWGQQVIVDNRPGATGMIGAAAVARAAPDGYTLLMGHVNSQAIAPSISQKPPYDPLRDFACVAYVGFVPNVLVVRTSTPARNVKELVAMARAHPGEVTFASPGVGSTNHLAGEMFRLANGIDIVHVPYKGSSPAIADMLGGQIVMNFDAMSSVVHYIRQGRMRPLAVTTAERDPQFPNVPTLRELGLPELEVTNWYGVVAPAATPPEIVARLNAELNRIIQLPDVKARLGELGTRTNPMTPDQFTAFLKTEIAKYARVAKAAGVRMD